jgi:hypothetical protein
MLATYPLRMLFRVRHFLIGLAIGAGVSLVAFWLAG